MSRSSSRNMRRLKNRSSSESMRSVPSEDQSIHSHPTTIQEGIELQNVNPPPPEVPISPPYPKKDKLTVFGWIAEMWSNFFKHLSDFTLFMFNKSTNCLKTIVYYLKTIVDYLYYFSDCIVTINEKDTWLIIHMLLLTLFILNIIFLFMDKANIIGIKVRNINTYSYSFIIIVMSLSMVLPTKKDISKYLLSLIISIISLPTTNCYRFIESYLLGKKPP